MNIVNIIITAIITLVSTFIIYLIASYRTEFIIYFDFFLHSLTQGITQLLVLIYILLSIVIYKKFKFLFYYKLIATMVIIAIMITIVFLSGFYGMNKPSTNNDSIDTLGYFGIYTKEKNLLYRKRKNIIKDKELALKLNSFKHEDDYNLSNKDYDGIFDTMPNYFELEFFNIPNILMFKHGKEALLRSIHELDNFISIVVIEENNFLKIEYIIQRHPEEQDDQRNVYYKKIFNTFTDIINIKGVDKTEVLKDLILYMNEVSKRSGIGLVIESDSKHDVSTNMISNFILNKVQVIQKDILTKYSLRTSDSKTINNISRLLAYEKAASYYFFAFESLIQEDYDGAINNILESIAEVPYFPLDTFDDFKLVYQAIYHQELYEKQELIKSLFQDDNLTTNYKEEDIFTSPYYMKLAKEYEVMPMSIKFLSKILDDEKGNISNKAYSLLEKKLYKLSNDRKNSIYTFFYADILYKLSDINKDSKEDMLQKIRKSKQLHIDFLENDGRLDYVSFYKISNLTFMEESIAKEANEKYTTEYWIKQINEHERKYGPRP